MKKIKLMHLITGLEVGGAETVLSRVLPRMHSDFENVVVGILPGKTEEKLKRAKIHTYVLLPRKKSIWQAIWRFKKIVEKEKPDILITYLIHADLFGRIFGKLFGIKKIVCSKRGMIFKHKFLAFLDRLTSFLVQKYLCVSRPIAEELINKLFVSPKKVEVVPNGVILKDFQFQIDVEKKRGDLGLKKEEFVMVYVANLNERKNHKVLISAFKKLINKYPSLVLLLVGKDQGTKVQIEKQIKSLKIPKGKIRILGYREDVIEILKISDLFVFPSLSEGMPNAVLEAMAAGLPIVASDILPNRELIKNKKNGLLFPPKSVSKLVQCVEQLIKNPDLRKKYAQNALNIVKENFTIEKTVKKFEKIYRELA